jgi:hypothetical protein
MTEGVNYLDALVNIFTTSDSTRAWQPAGHHRRKAPGRAGVNMSGA